MDIKVYEDIFADIRKKLDNPDAIYTLHDGPKEFKALASDIPVIDDCLSGGLPEGKIVEVFGPEASGKTTLMLHFIAAAQRRGEVVFYIDAECALDTMYAARIGVDFNTLMMSQPDTGEQALDAARTICDVIKDRGGMKALLVIDSIPALVPSELFQIYAKEGFESSNALGAQARMLSQYLPPLVNSVSSAGATLVFINQERDKIGVVYGSPTTTPGGRAVKFFSSMRLKVQRIGYYESGGQRAGIRATMTPVKSKVFSNLGRSAEFIIGNDGINQEAALAQSAIKNKIVEKGKGAWMKFGERSFQGLPKLEQALKDEPELKKQIVALLKGEQPSKPAATPTPTLTPSTTQPTNQDAN